MKKGFIFLFFFVIIFSGFISASNVGLIEDSTWQSNLTGVRYSATALGDLDGDDDLDLIITGCLSAGGLDCDGGVISKIYINNGTTLTENSQWQSNLTGLGWSSTSFGDIDNDGDLDLALTGCTSATNIGGCTGNLFSKIYINNGSNLAESNQWQDNLTAIFDGSIIFGDIDNDGNLDLALTGDTSSGKIAKIYLNNGTSLVESSQWQSNLTAVRSGSIIFGDIDNDGNLDLALTGESDGVTSKTKIYINNGTSFVEDSTWQQNLIATQDSSILFGDYDNDGDLDLVLIGVGDYLFIYQNNGTTFIEHQKNSGEGGDLGGGLFDGSIAWGDYDNDGDLDFVGMGLESGRNAIYENNESKNYNFSIDSITGTNFTNDNMHNGPLAWIDLDNDTDLDLIAIGTKTTVGILARVYISNASLTKNNTKPNPTTTSFSSSYSEGIFNLSWGNGTDVETNTSGLYYNLMVGNSTTNHTVVSGIYGGSSGGGTGGGGASGYFGNMMQRKSISLNKYLAEGTYNWYVQTIDTGLAKSNWSAIQSIVVGSDVNSPNLTSISSSVTSTTATITWTTDEDSNSSVLYGTTTSLGFSSGSTSLTSSHSVTLSSLSASTLYYYNVTSCDYWGNCNTSVQYSFTTSATPTDDSSSSSSGGGGGSSTTPVTTTNETDSEITDEEIFDIDFSKTTTGNIKSEQNDVKTFSFNGETIHKITLLEITNIFIKIIIESEPIILILNLGETKQIDINQDNIKDIEIKLISITNGIADLLLTKLKGAEIVAEEELEKDALFDVKVRITNWFKIIKSGREVIAEIEAFNVKNIGQVDILVNYYITNKENKTIAEGSDTLAVEAVTSFVRSLRVPYDAKAGKYLFNVDIKYQEKLMASGHTEFRVIRNYEIIIVVGIIILIVVGIFVYLWKIKRKEEKDIGNLKKMITKLKRGKK